MADTWVTPDNPGIHVYAPGWPGAPEPTGDYLCHCGASGEATGPTEVKALVSEYLAHQTTHKDR
ncbi:hypothetical protein [Streptacidiphilus anmyonensis]|uniref:hypothetical protein n=1 Tax=Streptacidiphilus anmyonensis TaxID=405782 RepID=UPI0005A7C831|nr:hypothetical protein [Streptacidiphilus anmyonensis]